MASASVAGRSCLSRYLNEIDGLPLLTREEEQTIARRIGGADPEGAYHALVRANLGFVVKVALEYRGMGLPLEDLVSEGNLGLLEAVRRFDAARGTRFITCAVWWIRKSILTALAGRAGMVRLPHTQRRRLRILRRAEEHLSRALGRDPDLEEVSRQINLPAPEVDKIRRLRSRDVSLENRVGASGELALHDVLVDVRSIDPEAQLLARESRDIVRRLLRRLGERERRVLVDRYGLEGGEGMTLQRISERLGVSREAVRLIEMHAKGRMRRHLARLERQGAERRSARPGAPGPGGQRGRRMYIAVTSS